MLSKSKIAKNNKTISRISSRTFSNKIRAFWGSAKALLSPQEGDAGNMAAMMDSAIGTEAKGDQGMPFQVRTPDLGNRKT